MGSEDPERNFVKRMNPPPLLAAGGNRLIKKDATLILHATSTLPNSERGIRTLDTTGMNRML